MRGVIFAYANQLSFGDLDAGQVAGSKFGEELAIGNLFRDCLRL